MPSKVKFTPLYAWHLENGANLVNFGDYHMPLWYPNGAKKEHLSVLLNAGIFDTSHMACIIIKGKDSFNVLQNTFSRDLRACVNKNKEPLKSGQCVYGVYLNQKGYVIDDAIVYKISEDKFMCVVNSGMGAPISQRLLDHSKKLDVEITDLTDKIGKIDIQGIMCLKILNKVLKLPETVLKDMNYFSFKGTVNGLACLVDVELIDNTPILLSRTGYTGELGFEIFMNSDSLVKVWEMILDAGKEFDLIPCGLAARDSLRVGSLLPLSHQDIGHWPFINNPWLFALPYNNEKTGFTKSFIGDQALLNPESVEYTYPFVGYDLRKIEASDKSVVLDDKEKTIGAVLTCVTDMAIGRYNDKIVSISTPDRPKDFKAKGLSCGFIKVNSKLDYGQVVYLKDNRRKIKVMIVKDIRPNRTARSLISKFL